MGSEGDGRLIFTRHPGQAVALEARSRSAGICREGGVCGWVPDSLRQGVGFRDDGWDYAFGSRFISRTMNQIGTTTTAPSRK